MGRDRPDQLSTSKALTNLMECWPVGKAIGNVAKDGPELVEG